jgi:aspartyl-tRNA(Asn)/glutamyl-tRNA(Gln) amidotransferase subunit A
LGTDLGGSIRAPASLCGVVGIKPTLGRIPYTGIQPQTLHRAIHVGPIARTVGDVALGMSILAGADDVDIYTPPVPVPDYAPLDVDLTQLKVGWSPTTGVPVEPEVQRSVAEAAAAMGELGMNVEQVEIPALTEKNASAISTVIYTMDARRYSAPTIAGRESELTPMFRARFVDGNTFTIDEYLNAAQEWEDLRQAVKEYFTRYDIFLCPTVPMPAFPHGQNEFNIEGRTLAGRHTLRITLPWDLTGSPAISVPFGFSSDGLPIGVQVVGRHFDELTLLQVARGLEASRPQTQRPSLG